MITSESRKNTNYGSIHSAAKPTQQMASNTMQMKKLNKILLVDDDQIGNFITEALIQELNCTEEIHVAYNGLEAFNYLESSLNETSESNFPDLILLDINMPVMDGFELLEKLEQLQSFENKNIPVIMLTTSVNDRDFEKAKKHQVAGYFNKPLTEEMINDIIQKFVLK